MRKIYVELNANKTIRFTPTSYTVNDTVELTINGISYSVQGTGTLSTTIDNFILANKRAIGDFHNCFIEDNGSYIDLNNVSSIRTISANNATITPPFETEDRCSINVDLFGTDVLNENIEFFISDKNNLGSVSLEFSSSEKALNGLSLIKDASTRNGTYPYNLNGAYKASLYDGAITTEDGVLLTTEDNVVIITEQA
jgi:hypothetical protein